MIRLTSQHQAKGQFRISSFPVKVILHSPGLSFSVCTQLAISPGSPPPPSLSSSSLPLYLSLLPPSSPTWKTWTPQILIVGKVTNWDYSKVNGQFKFLKTNELHHPDLLFLFLAEPQDPAPFRWAKTSQTYQYMCGNPLFICFLHSRLGKIIKRRPVNILSFLSCEILVF